MAHPLQRPPRGPHSLVAGRLRHFSYEALERRELLAGNVDVAVVRGNVWVRGDNADNQFAVLQTSDSALAIVGLNGTRIDGSTEPYITRAVPGDLRIDARQGDDLVLIGNEVDEILGLSIPFGFGAALGDVAADFNRLSELLRSQQLHGNPWPQEVTLPRKLIVNTGDGLDRVAFMGEVRQRLEAILGAGNDTLLVRAQIDGNLKALGGAGDDTLHFSGLVGGTLIAKSNQGADEVLLAGAIVIGRAVIETGDHDDLVDIANVGFADDVRVRSGEGQDSVIARVGNGGSLWVERDLAIDTGTEQDYVELTGHVTGSIGITMGTGSDGVLLKDLEIGVDLSVTLGNGLNGLAASDVDVGRRASVVGGADRDEISLLAFAVDEALRALLGSGDDKFEFISSSTQSLELRGGKGTDSLLWDDAAPAPAVLMQEIETIGLIEEEDTPEDVILVYTPGTTTIHLSALITTTYSAIAFTQDV